MIEKNSKRFILQKTNLFEEAIAYSTLNKIIKELKEQKFEKGIINISGNRLYIVISGEVLIKVNDTIVETLREFDYFGGLNAILDYQSVCSFELTKETVLCSIPGEILKDIPIVRWKIIEKNALRKQKLLKNKIKAICSD